MAVFLLVGSNAAALRAWVPERLHRKAYPVCVDCLPRTLEDLATDLAWRPRGE